MVKSTLTHFVYFFFLSFLGGQFYSISNSAFAEESVDLEPTIQASFILKFSEFIQWPEYYSSLYSEEPLNICLHEEDKFGDIFDYVNDHDILRRKILIRHSVPISELKSCHFAFLGSLDTDKIDNLINEVKSSPVLVVTNSEEISHSLVAINFRRVNNKVRFEINLSAFERSGIKVSSDLLNLAINVVRID
jgi:hypothetical protein